MNSSTRHGAISNCASKDAWMELDKLEPKATAHPETLLLRLDILIGLKRWEDAIAMGIGCYRDWSTYDTFFLKTATALIRFGDWQNAYGLLTNAPESLHALPEYHYAIARRVSRQGLIRDAKDALKECFDRDKGYKQRSLDDPDLKRLWDSI